MRKMKNNQSKVVLSCYLPFLVSVLLSGSLPLTLGAEDFNYIIGSERGPDRWGDVPGWEKCKTGRMQSPINIPLIGAEPTINLGTLSKNYKNANATLTLDHDVGIEWQGDAGSIKLDGTNYTLKNVHWHAPSEHTIFGIRFDLELHMVHINANSSNITVVAHLYRFGPPDQFLSLIMSRIQQLSETNPSIALGGVDPRNIVSNGLFYYRYMGSLTTPPCSENVTWLIDQNIKNVSRQQVQILRNAIDDNGEGNARPIQPLNNRTIRSGPLWLVS